MPKFDWSNLAPFVTAVKTACGAGTLAMGVHVVDDVKKSFGSYGRYKSGPAGKPPNRQRSRLVNSIQAQQSGIPVIVGSNVPYGWVHETGNGGRPIAAKKTKYLPVPLNASARALLEDGGTGGLKTKGTFKLVFMGRHLILVRDKKFKAMEYVTGADGLRKYKTIENTEPRFILKKSIRMPKRPFMAPALARARKNPTLTNAFAVATTVSLETSAFPVKVVPR